MRNLNLADATTPEQAVNTLRDAAESFAQDAGEMDATDFLIGKHWREIAQELDRAADRIVRRVTKSGYPYRNSRS